MSRVTVFDNLYTLKTPKYADIDYVLEKIGGESCVDIVSNIRLEKDKSSRNQIKKNFLVYYSLVSLQREVIQL